MQRRPQSAPEARRPVASGECRVRRLPLHRYFAHLVYGLEPPYPCASIGTADRTSTDGPPTLAAIPSQSANRLHVSGSLDWPCVVRYLCPSPGERPTAL